MVIMAENELAPNARDRGLAEDNGRGNGAGGNGSRRGGNRSALARAGRAIGGGDVNTSAIERVLSVAGGAALLGLALRRRGAASPLTGLLGAVLLHRGATGHCAVYGSMGLSTADEQKLVQQHGRAAVLDAEHAFKVVRSVTINLPRAELYRFWRNFENLPRLMSHLESVTVLDDRRSRWTAKAPAGQHVEWEAEIINELPDQLLAWRSVNEATVPNAGSVQFRDAPGGRGTEIKVTLEYDPPGGQLGRLVAKLFRENPDLQVREDLRRFKAMMEAGEAPTIEGQPACR